MGYQCTTDVINVGYYSIKIYSHFAKRVTNTNNERAFVIARLQDSLNRLSITENPESRHCLATYVDLLGFSILTDCISLIVFSISKGSVKQLADIITLGLYDYQASWLGMYQPTSNSSGTLSVTIKKLDGPNDALAQTVYLHSLHTDWQNDRYSSIGFYINDRRGAWFHNWRLSSLYGNIPSRYERMVRLCINKRRQLQVTTT